MSTSTRMSSRPRGEDWCDDEIDLLEVVRTLWRGRYWIAGATVALALLAWVISTWWILPRYQAAAYLVLHPWPVKIADLALPAPPDIQSLTSLAQEEAVLQRAFGQDRAQSLQTEVQPVGDDGFRLLVTASDPEEAAQGANRWAEIVLEEINHTYGLLEWQRNLEAEQERRFVAYQAAEEKYAAALNTGQVLMLQIQLNALTNEHACLARRLTDISSLTRTVQQLRARWSEMPAEEQIPVQDALLFLSLSQRGSSLSLCSSAPPLQLQVTTNGPSFTVAQGLRSLETLEDLLAEQTQRLEQRHEALEAQIAQVAAALSTAREEQDQARRMRDWAWERYTRIVDLTRALETWQMTERPLVSVGMHAVPPSEPVSPRPVLNAIVAGMSGFFLSSMAVLMTSWWASRSDATPSEQEDDS